MILTFPRTLAKFCSPLVSFSTIDSVPFPPPKIDSEMVDDEMIVLASPLVGAAFPPPYIFLAVTLSIFNSVASVVSLIPTDALFPAP